MQLALIVGSLVVCVVVLTGLVGFLIDKSGGEEKDAEVEASIAQPEPERDFKVTRR